MCTENRKKASAASSEAILAADIQDAWLYPSCLDNTDWIFYYSVLGIFFSSSEFLLRTESTSLETDHKVTLQASSTGHLQREVATIIASG